MGREGEGIAGAWSHLPALQKKNSRGIAREEADGRINKCCTKNCPHFSLFSCIGEVNETLEDGSGWCRFAAPLQLVIGPPLRHPSLLPGGPAIQIRCKGKIKQDLI
jgi:hypothetical protein